MLHTARDEQAQKEIIDRFQVSLYPTLSFIVMWPTLLYSLERSIAAVVQCHYDGGGKFQHCCSMVLLDGSTI